MRRLNWPILSLSLPAAARSFRFNRSTFWSAKFTSAISAWPSWWCRVCDGVIISRAWLPPPVLFLLHIKFAALSYYWSIRWLRAAFKIHIASWSNLVVSIVSTVCIRLWRHTACRKRCFALRWQLPRHCNGSVATELLSQTRNAQCRWAQLWQA